MNFAQTSIFSIGVVLNELRFKIDIKSEKVSTIFKMIIGPYQIKVRLSIRHIKFK
jgi:hypothetical protein